MLDLLINKLDRLICSYLGLEQQNDIDKPKSIKISNKKLIIYKNHSFKRHRYQEAMEHIEYKLEYSDEENKKIAMAAGKAIAKNLSISCEKVDIRKCP